MRAHLSAVPNPPWWSVLVIDPGVWTGWCWIGFNELDLIDFNDHELIAACGSAHVPMFLAGQLDASDENAAVHALVAYASSGLQRTVAMSERAMATSDVKTMVVSEDFSLRERTKDRSLLSPVRLNAKLSYAFEDLGFDFLDDQSSSDAKSTATDDRLKRWGLWTPGRPHQNDAVRHLVLWLRRLRQA